MDPTDNIDQILNALADEIAAQGLRKDEGSPPAEESSSPGGSPSAPPPGGPPGSAPPAGGPPPPDASAPPPSPSPAGPPSPGGPPGSAPPAGGPPTDPAQVAQLVQGMDDVSLKAFYAATRQELMTRGVAGAGSPGAGPSAIPGGAPPSPGGPPPDMPPAMKGEGSPNGSAPRAGHLGKSEPDPVLAEIRGLVAAQAAQIATLQKSVQDSDSLMAKAVQMVAGKPLRKAVTEVPYVPKTPAPAAGDTMSRGDIDRHLRDLDKSALKKSDREAMNAFYGGGQVDVNSIRHLLKQAQ